MSNVPTNEAKKIIAKKMTGKHRSTGAIIRDKDGNFLMFDRVNPPYGWAISAGHIEEGEDPEKAMLREIKEETSLEVKKYRLLFQEFLPWNSCVGGVVGHDWWLYEALEWEGNPIMESEHKEMRWVKPEDLKNYKLEEAVEYWFKKLGYI